MSTPEVEPPAPDAASASAETEQVPAQDVSGEGERKAASKRKPSSVEKIWGREVVEHGYAGVPSILIRAQKRLKITPTQMNIVVQMLDYWREPTRKPFPTKKEIANRIGITEKTVQNNVRQLEKANLIRREYRKTAVGDFTSNLYHLDGLVNAVKALEPEFTKVKAERAKARKDLETPEHLREEAVL